MNKKIKIKDFLFFGAYILYLFTKIFFVDSAYKDLLPKHIGQMLIYFIYFLLVIKILYDEKFNLRNLCITLSMMFLGGIVYFHSNAKSLCEIIIFMYAARNIKFEKIATVTMLEIFVLSVIVLISCKLGIIENYTFNRNDNTIRNALGFSYVSKLPVFYMELVFLYLYLKNKKQKNVSWLIIFILVGLNYVIFYFTDIKNNFVLTLLFILLYIIFIKLRKKSMKNKIINIFLRNIYIVCCLFSIIVVANYNTNNENYVKLNDLTTGRLSISHRMIEEYKVSLFGNNIVMHGSSAVKYGNISSDQYSYIDNAYIQILLRYGLIFFILFGFIFIWAEKKFIEDNEYLLCFWLAILAISSIFDDTIIILQYNCSLLILFQLIRERKEKNEI